jgi:hypothetical protein
MREPGSMCSAKIRWASSMASRTKSRSSIRKLRNCGFNWERRGFVPGELLRQICGECKSEPIAAIVPAGTTFKTSHWYLGHSESLACTALALKALSLGFWVVRGHREELIWMI